MDNAVGDKVVIFSQWERMTRLVAQELEAAGIEYVYLHGNVPPKERRERVERFCSDANVRVFLSTDAGSVGLNLQVANVVINLDVPWNPAVLEQRIGRIHRIGQQTGVEVINLISAGTIEEDMLSKLRFKASLFEGVMDGGADAVFLGSSQFDGLLNGLSNYMEENEEATAEAILQSDEEQPVRRLPVQTELRFNEEAEPETPQASEAPETPPAAEPLTPQPASAAADFLRSLADLLTADEATRQRVAAMLRELS